MVRLRLFALARQLAAADTIEVELPEPATIGQLRAQLAAACPALRLWHRICSLPSTPSMLPMRLPSRPVRSWPAFRL